MAHNDRKLFWRCLFSTILQVIGLVTTALAWGHWAYTLNTCSNFNYNCGCILFGTSYATGFSGSRIQICEYVALVQAPILLLSIALIFYYGYRTFIKKRKAERKLLNRSNPLQSARQTRRDKHVVLDSQAVRESIDPPSSKVRIILLIMSLLMALILLANAVVLTAGFYSSCSEYRRQLVHELALNGNAAQVVGSRMSCVSVFDFLDYLQPDRVVFGDPFPPYIRKDRINTGITLMIAKTVMFMNFINWVHMTVLHIKGLRRPGCCGKSS